jgi:hypothetical protein
MEIASQMLSGELLLAPSLLLQAINNSLGSREGCTRAARAITLKRLAKSVLSDYWIEQLTSPNESRTASIVRTPIDDLMAAYSTPWLASSTYALSVALVFPSEAKWRSIVRMYNDGAVTQAA